MRPTDSCLRMSMRFCTTSCGLGGLLTVGGTLGGFSRAGRKARITRGASGRGRPAIVIAEALCGATAAAPPAAGRTSATTPAVSAHSKAMSPGRSIDGTILFQAPRVTPCGPSQRGLNTVLDASPRHAGTPLRQVHLPQGRSGLAAARRGGAAPRQARVPGRLRGLRPDRRAPAAVLLPDPHPRRLPPDAAVAVPQPRSRARIPRPARAERTDEVVLGVPLLPGDDQ